MNRRSFLAAASAAALHASEKPKLLLPSDKPDEFSFRLMWYNPVPPLDPATYQLKIYGLVEKPVMLSIADMRALPHETQNARMKCVQCWSSRTTWGGFRAESLFDLVKPLKSAKAFRLDSADKWYEHYSLTDISKPRVMFAMDMGGQPLADRHGFPLRLLDPSRYGYKSPKLITAIEFVPEEKGSMACDVGPYYSPTGEIKPGYDHPLDIGPEVRRRIPGGEITDY
jgi:DMSO/TMAO reductase YedYZ molybdopterin-dependent catalytic subunit